MVARPMEERGMISPIMSISKCSSHGSIRGLKSRTGVSKLSKNVAILVPLLRLQIWQA